ncbi:hypothetical protein FAES_3250 [Fibrella aestuarina BUZ 2]|uniref:Uncharacterized protein n=1 Tax=Fibrella aestuarina BUZ 2 TaxID=1166018 RepID=I0KAV6_9BACT|nr:hypothetical protein [Fibrella aestuarina]CCH01259.1 hypothetical protein FAES_3250 [Fibrella aestuarina BUZ 2]
MENTSSGPQLNVTSGFDLNSILAEEGLAEAPESGPEQAGLNDTEKQALGQITTNTPPLDQTLAPGQKAPVDASIPEYLKADASTEVAPVTIDWGAKYKEAFGEDIPADIEPTPENVLGNLTMLEEARRFIQQVPEYAELQARLSRTYEPGEAGDHARFLDNQYLLEQDLIRQMPILRDNDEDRDRYMLTYIQEGALTAKGQQCVDQLRQQKNQWLEQQQEAAWEHGANVANRQAAARQQTANTIKTLNPGGVPLSDDDRTALIDFINSDGLRTKLTNYDALTPEEQGLMALVLNPQLRARWLAAHYERGAKEGANRRLASQLN